jgi:CRISPR/Cas system CSM-associated protein Csm3 (group 7 of RAMP superfamily)
VNLWGAKHSRKITERIVVEANLVLQTPAHFGNGDGDEIIDMPLLVDPLDGESPFLSGASIAGALRNYLRANLRGYNVQLPELSDDTSVREERESLVTRLFGGFKGDDKGEQSPLIIDDAIGSNGGIELRDGVGINPQSRTADYRKLFNLEAWQAGTTFPLRFELVIREQDDATALKQALATALHGLETGEITLGARKRRGYGQIAIQGDWRVKCYDLTTAKGLVSWLEQSGTAITNTSIATALGVSMLDQDARCYFDVRATFSLDGALLIRGNSLLGHEGPDAMHLHARQPDGQLAPVISGTSLAGALRARARKIAQTIGVDLRIVADIFGDMDNTQKQASRITVKETVIQQPTNTELVQNRISIDRFTGGVNEGALFNEQPVFGSEQTEVALELRLINPKPSEKGLLMLLLKDLWTSDLPLGGTSSIGRGRLKGKEAILTWRNGSAESKAWRIVQEGSKLRVEGAKDDLEEWVGDLVQEVSHAA